MNTSLYFLYVCINLYLHIFYPHHFFLYLFICHLFVCNILFLPFLLLHFLTKFRLNYMHELHKHTLLIIVAYFVNTFYYTNFMFLHEIFKGFSSPFSAFIIMSICTHSHGSAKCWWHSAISIHMYVVTSTKI